ncbi:MAG: DUF2889 domain-containing protein [Gammaproteobacteria bacterium]|nr:DUF2889 domain-containing protein [Gammaproteobacteria bacterium]MBU1440348.1 DUF2889 domain-containing protein [Gammaproteobacteria bacterium]MBU2287648.1 DUF2889 domain-containing protein [Gammaproteobacteria bacterium]MBU2407949.1 DUF2889 domain-containing protein [Gammaproteobacteria bacterium]
MEAQVRRRELHLRRIELRAFARDDGLWDIEAQLRDEKPYAYLDPVRGEREPGDPVHDIRIRLTLDDERVIRDVDVQMGSMPFGTCHELKDSFRILVGERIGPGWRNILKKFPRTATCTHAQELLVPMATAALQGMALGRAPEGTASIVRDPATTTRPFFVDDCHSWRADGPAVAHFYPQFSRKKD